jgi:predicted dehydrogenase
MTQTRESPLRIGVIGAARIARDFVIGAGLSRTVLVAAVASRDPDKATRFARELGIPRAYGSYAELLADPEIDAVYNPLPNTLHAEWSMEAAKAGKHVLCEKPLATNAGEARAMFNAARHHGVMLVEGFPYRAQPHALKLEELIASGAIGRVQTMQAAFGFTMTDTANIRLDPGLAGGALLDAGTYPVSLVRLVAGQRASRAHAVARWHASGVDQTLVATLEHPGGLLAQISCSFTTGIHRHALIAGDAGVIQTTYLNNPPLDRPALLQLKRGVSSQSVYESVEVPACNGFQAEAESFERLVRLGWEHWTGATPAESVDIAMALDAIIESARSRRPVDIAA